MLNDLISPCPHCRGTIVVRLTAQQGGISPKRTEVRSFEFDARSLLPSGAPMQSDNVSNVGDSLSPGEKRTSTLYHQWQMSDVWTSLAISGVSGILAGALSIPICIGLHVKAFWPPIVWLGVTTITWLIKSIDFFIDDKAIIKSDEQERKPDPVPIVVNPPSVDVTIKSASGKSQKRARLRAPKSNHDGLWQYARDLVSGRAYPSYEGGRTEGNGAKDYGYTPGEFDGRSDSWRPVAIAGGILEEDPHKSRGYRLTEDGRKALVQVARHRLREFGGRQ